MRTQEDNRDLPWPTHDWRRADPQEIGLDVDALSHLDDVARSVAPQIESLLLVRHGLIVFEAYYHGIQAGSYLSISSITKSVISALVGVALQRGLRSTSRQGPGERHRDLSTDVIIPALTAV